MSETNAHPNYVKVWAILVVLLMVSVAGPLVGIQWLTLALAFGIAFVKAYLVARNFMHINFEKPWIAYLMIASIVFMIVLFAGVAPDVMKHQGLLWTNDAAEAAQSAAPAAHE